MITSPIRPRCLSIVIRAESFCRRWVSTRPGLYTTGYQPSIMSICAMTSILQFAGATEKLRSIQLWATASVLVSAPLFFGSVDQFWIAVWIVVLSITTILGVSVPLNIVQVRVVWAFLSVCLIYAI